MSIITTEDGSHSIHSDQFGVSYHSKYGAIQESLHVFIDAALRFKIQSNPASISILELGFGTGLNALLTLQESQKHKMVFNYETFEAFPIEIKTAEELNYLEMLERADLQDHFLQMHTCEWSTPIVINPTFNFTKHKKSFSEIDSSNLFDVIYFDAFAPNAQPELWEPALLEKLYKALKPNGVLTTYCAKGQVKRDFKKVGFEIQSIPGPPGKREMTRAIKV